VGACFTARGGEWDDFGGEVDACFSTGKLRISDKRSLADYRLINLY
jgi:hypothetical protein